MTVEILMPRLTDTMHEGLITTWYKKEGERVSRGEALFAVETDKATVDVEAGEAGVLLQIVAQEGESAKVGERVAVIGESIQDLERLPREGARVPSQMVGTPVIESGGQAPRLNASPVAKRRAKEMSIDLALVPGTGRGGLITEKDLDAYLQSRQGADRSRLSQEGGEERIQLKGVARVMADRMALSANIPQATTFAEIDVTDLMRLRQSVSIRLTPFVVRAAAEALKSAKLMNASLEGDEVVLHGQVNVGVSVSTPRGLVVPVVHHAETKGVGQIAEEVTDLAGRARGNQLSLDDVAGATFTVTNSGVFGSLFFAPRVSPPQSAVLGMGKVTQQPAVHGEEIVIRSMMIASLSYDHRIIDGETAVRFLQDVKRLLEAPEGLL